MPYTLLSFDLDGTLVDTAGEIAEAVNRAIAEFGVARRPVDEITALVGGGTHELMRRLQAQLLLEGTAPAEPLPLARLTLRFEHHYAQTSGRSGLPYPGCVDGLARLQAHGVRLACVTNKSTPFARQVLEATGLAGCFELLIGGDTLPVRKPDRAVIDHLLRTLGGRREETAHVGDSATDVLAARQAGIAAWAVPYGYNGGQAIETAGPDRVFRDIAEVADHVLRVNAQAGPADARSG